MEANHLSYFKVENFKKFDELEINNIGQFNLVVGDNNVGKTSLLEALLVEKEFFFTLRNLHYILTIVKRYNLKYPIFSLGFLSTFIKINNKPDELVFRFSSKDDEGNLKTCKLSRATQHGIFLWSNGEQEISSTINDALQRLEEVNNQFNLDIPFIPFGFNYDHNLTFHYSNLIQKFNNKKEAFMTGLGKIIPDITGVEVSAEAENTSILLISQKSKNVSSPLATFGDGFIKLFRLLISIVAHSGKRLMIDEVDTGVHYSRMTDFWKTIIQASIDNKVQLFATTHSKECLQCFKEAIAELKHENEARVIRLVEHKDKSIKSYTYNFEQLEQSIDYNEIR